MKKITKILSTNFCALSKIITDTNKHHFKLGQFPKSLQYERPFKITTLSNGMRIGSLAMDSQIASITVFINCGSRSETPQSSGTAHFLQHLHFKGTKNRSREQLQIGVQRIGGNLNAYTTRQNTCYMMNVFKDDLQKAVQIVGDMITNSLYNVIDVNFQRSTIMRQLQQTQKLNPVQTTIQFAHKGIYRNHVMALPILGSIKNIQTISKQMIEQYHNQNYVGQNILLIASGPIQHDRLLQAATTYINVPKKPPKPSPPLTKPKFYPGISVRQSDLTDLVHMIICYQAASFFDPQFFSFLLLQRIMSDRPQTQLQLKILQHCPSFKFQKHLASIDIIKKQNAFYTSYWDSGIFGNYFLCPPDKVHDVFHLELEGLKMYAENVTNQQIQISKRKVFIQILQHQTQNDLTQSLANNIMYYNRKVSNKEIAQRVSVVGAKQIQNLCKKLIQKSHKNICLWGNINKVPFIGNLTKQ